MPLRGTYMAWWIAMLTAMLASCRIVHGVCVITYLLAARVYVKVCTQFHTRLLFFCVEVPAPGACTGC